MTPIEFRRSLADLGLRQVEAAQLLSVSPRTVQRWVDGEELPGPVQQAVYAWLALHRRGLAWRPDELSIAADDAEQIAIARSHAIALDEVLKRVEARGGPSAPWRVDLRRCRATLGPLQLTFYKLRNGGFSPQSYRRSDELGKDMKRDWPLIEDAFACIARAFAAEGHSLQQRLAFQIPKLDNDGTLTLWETSLCPPVGAKIDCQVLREALGLSPEVTDAQCRLLVARNRVLLTEVAERLFAAQRFELGPYNVRVLTISLEDLRPLASRFELNVLDTSSFAMPM